MTLDKKTFLRKAKKGTLLALALPFSIIGRVGQIVVNNALAPRKTFWELEKLAYKESAKYIFDHMEACVLFTDIKEFWSHAINEAPEKGLVMEFGVFGGKSINFFAKELQAKSDKRPILGFDSFEGLSENWSGYSLLKDKFDRQGKLPAVEKNVTLIKGWVDDTFEDALSKHLDQHDGVIAFMHLDMDTYTPTKFVLEKAIPYLQAGSVIAFDELLGYTGWRENEYKAMVETIEANFEYEFISFSEHRTRGYVSMYTRAALRIIKKK